jgi:hypothetical protein
MPTGGPGQVLAPDLSSNLCRDTPGGQSVCAQFNQHGDEDPVRATASVTFYAPTNRFAFDVITPQLSLSIGGVVTF